MRSSSQLRSQWSQMGSGRVRVRVGVRVRAEVRAKVRAKVRVKVRVGVRVRSGSGLGLE